jgi:hypothetical protein
MSIKASKRTLTSCSTKGVWLIKNEKDQFKMKKVSISFMLVIVVALMLFSGVTSTKGAEAPSDKDKMERG